MKISPVSLRHLSTALAVFATGFALSAGPCRADSPSGDDDTGVQVLTRGPVHEAFAEVIAFKPTPGVVVPKAPPEMIDEIPPDQKPQGDNVTWIPGYWAWDDERNDFLWVSGIWRALPPGRQWVSGYWAPSGNGYQWTSGYWADTSETQTTYLPTPPPATLENGPDVAAPSDDYQWVPGCWIWQGDQYAWQPGYWIQGQDDWDWNPDYYVWTPRGYVFVDGYWDYSVERRGVLFAPAYIKPGVRLRPGYHYSPGIVIDLSVLPGHLFLRPRDHHYYFGDYYDASYSKQGYHVSFSFQSGGYGYDPIYTHQRWTHRQDPKWESHIQSKYQDRQDHKNVRPPRTWVTQKSAAKSAVTPLGEDKPMATSFAELSKTTGSPRQFQPVATDEKQQLAQRGQQVKQFRDGRRTQESSPPSQPAAKPGEFPQPFTMARPKSPIFSRPSSQPRKGSGPAPTQPNPSA